MPYIVLEAVAAPMPMIATKVGAIPEIFREHSGRLVPPGDVAALAEAMGGRGGRSGGRPARCSGAPRDRWHRPHGRDAGGGRRGRLSRGFSPAAGQAALTAIERKREIYLNVRNSNDFCKVSLADLA